MDAPEIVDLVDVAKTFSGRNWVLNRIVGATHEDALRGTNTSAEFATDALFHSVFVTVENVTTVNTNRLGRLFFRILRCHALLAADLAQADEKTTEVTHQSTTPSSRRAFEVAIAALRSP